MMNSRGQITETLRLRNVFNDPSSTYRRGAFDELLYGFTAEPTQRFDKFFTQEVFDLTLFLKLKIIKFLLFFR
jgi:hypothetical protein